MKNAETTETTGYTVSEEVAAHNKREWRYRAYESLVAYFSRTGENYGVGHIEKGNTHIVADMITEQVDADLFEIITVVPYPHEYEAVQKPQSRSRKKMPVPNCQLP